MRLRPVVPSDRGALERLVRAQPNFGDDEVRWAVRLALRAAAPNDGEYQTWVDEIEGEITAFVCFGRSPRTFGTFELFWIAVHPSQQRRGMGGELLRFVEEEATRQGGRLLVLETSSSEGFRVAVDFYRKHGFREVSRIKDFYRVTDDKIVFSRLLS